MKSRSATCRELVGKCEHHCLRATEPGHLILAILGIMPHMAVAALATAAVCIPLAAQDKLWQRVASRNTEGIKPKDVEISDSQAQSVIKPLKSQRPPWTCDVDEPNGEWLENLLYRSVAVSATSTVLLVEAGRGCARGGQGSNGAMWLIRLNRRAAPDLLAGEEQDFGGFLYSIEPTMSKGYRDVIVGWHAGGGQTALTYFQFNGRTYKSISTATLTYDERGNPRIEQR